MIQKHNVERTQESIRFVWCDVAYLNTLVGHVASCSQTEHVLSSERWHNDSTVKYKGRLQEAGPGSDFENII